MACFDSSCTSESHADIWKAWVRRWEAEQRIVWEQKRWQASFRIQCLVRADRAVDGASLALKTRKAAARILWGQYRQARAQAQAQLDLATRRPPDDLVGPREQQVLTSRSVSGIPLYRPLSSGTGQIRLLRLSPLTPQATMRAEMVYTTLDSCPEYTALSYTWGDNSVFARIHLDQEN